MRNRIILGAAILGIGVLVYMLIGTPGRYLLKKSAQREAINRDTNRSGVGSDGTIRRGFVMDFSQGNGQVLMAVIDKDVVKHYMIIDDSAFFNCADSGEYACRTRSGKWFCGNVFTGQVKKQITPSTELASSSYASVSPDGLKMAWVINANQISSLLVSDNNGDNSVELFRTSGKVLHPAWQPDGTLIAFYLESAGIRSMRTYSLVLSDVQTGNSRHIGGESLPTRLSGDFRDMPPLWSPDGQMVLFEGRYNNYTPWTTYCVTDITGKSIRKSAGRCWARDGSVYYCLMNSTEATGEVRLFRAATSEEPYSNESHLVCTIPFGPENVKVSQDGDYAIGQKDGKILLVSLPQGLILWQQDCPIECEVKWVTEQNAGDVSGVSKKD